MVDDWKEAIQEGGGGGGEGKYTGVSGDNENEVVDDWKEATQERGGGGRGYCLITNNASHGSNSIS